MLTLRPPVRAPIHAEPIPDVRANGAPETPLTRLHEAVGFRELLAMVRRNIVLVALIAGATVIAAGFFVRRQLPMYRATAALRIGDARRAVTSGIEDPEVEVERLSSPLLSQIQLLRSRALVGGVVDAEGLRLVADYRGFQPTLLGEVAIVPERAPDSLDLRFTAERYVVRAGGREAAARYGEELRLDGISFVVRGRPKTDAARWAVSSREAAIDRVLAALRVTPRTQTTVVDVSYSAPQPLAAQRVVSAIVTAFQELSVESAQLKSRRRRIFLEDQLRQTDSMLAQTQQTLSAHRRENQAYSSRSKIEAQQAALLSLDLRWEELDAERRTSAALLEDLERADPSRADERLHALVASPSLAANPIVAQFTRQLAQYQTTRDSLTTGTWRTSAEHPDVRRLDELIAGTRGKLVGAVRSHIATVDARLSALRNLRERNAASMVQLPAVEAEEVRLVEEVETIRSMADRLREEYQKARMAEAVEVGRVEIIDPAALPYEPVPQLRALKLLIGLLAGLVLGGIAARVREGMNTSLRRRDDIERMLRIPGLAVIPRVDGLRPADGDPLATEAYRGLHTNIMFAGTGRALRSIVVTSAAPGEGKTLTSANLAVRFAREGRRVLLVDCDLPRARLHRLFGESRGPGLAQVLAGALPVGEVIHTTTFPRLSLLTAGDVEGETGDVMRGDELETLLRQLCERFDLVLLDTPPVLALTDASILGAVADGVVLVVRAGRTPRDLVLAALRQLHAVHAHVLGAVLNDPAGTARRNGEYYGYGYGYAVRNGKAEPRPAAAIG